MIFEVRTDNHIENTDEISQFCRAEIDGVLPRYGDQIRRVEFSLKDTNSDKKGGVDKRCLIEITLAGHQPVVVEEYAPTLEGAISAAVDTVEKALDRTLGRLRDKNDRTSMSGQ
jgi:ribosome-associated translation inhibitor RaiA